jgi:hypothetical protein
MYYYINNFRKIQWLHFLLGALLLGVDSVQGAGLVGYRNDTNQAVVVQSTVVVNGMTRRSKPQTIFSGEVALDGLAYAGTRRITIADAKNPSQILFQGDVNAQEDLFFSIRLKTATVPIKGQPPSPPQVELIKTRPPGNSRMPQPPKK